MAEGRREPIFGLSSSGWRDDVSPASMDSVEVVVDFAGVAGAGAATGGRSSEDDGSGAIILDFTDT